MSPNFDGDRRCSSMSRWSRVKLSFPPETPTRMRSFGSMSWKSEMARPISRRSFCSRRRSGVACNMAPHYHGGVARAALRLAENAPGEVYVDSTCIDCETCRAVAPATFARNAGAGQSIVSRQPQGPAELRRALMALVSCPTASIGTVNKQDVSAAAAALPEEIEPGSGVYYCGYAAESSFGASSWLVRRPGGNVLVDSPR